MERVSVATDVSGKYSAHIGVAVHCNGQHAGVLFRVDKQAEAKILHLAWHYDLRKESVNRKYAWVVPNVPQQRAKQVAAYCRLVWDRSKNNRIPYGFSPPNDCLTASGDIKLGPSKLGLTCATFVLAVFDVTALPLVDYSTWSPREDDRIWQQETLRELEKGEASQDHIDAVRNEIGSIRYRPLEVGGAAASGKRPADFDTSLEYSSRLQKRLKTMARE